MGYMVHHAIIVTSFSDEDLEKAHKKAKKLFHKHPSDPTARIIAPVSEIVESPQNGNSSFFIGPDGSKEGWGASDDGDSAREAFMNWIDSQAEDDGSNVLDYAFVQYGDEGGNDYLIQSTNKKGDLV